MLLVLPAVHYIHRHSWFRCWFLTRKRYVYMFLFECDSLDGAGVYFTCVCLWVPKGVMLQMMQCIGNGIRPLEELFTISVCRRSRCSYTECLYRIFDWRSVFVIRTEWAEWYESLCVCVLLWGWDDVESDCEHVILVDDYIKLLKQFAMNCGPTLNCYSFDVMFGWLFSYRCIKA